jgi:HSP20 family protein
MNGMVQQRSKTGYQAVEQGQSGPVYGAMVGPGRWVRAVHHRTWHPPTDMYETREGYVVRVEIAGMDEADFKISLSDRQLVVAGERRDSCVKSTCHQIEISYGRFRSEVTLPGQIDRQNVEATYADGFLRIVLPKKAAQKVPVVRP